MVCPKCGAFERFRFSRFLLLRDLTVLHCGFGLLLFRIFAELHASQQLNSSRSLNLRFVKLLSLMTLAIRFLLM